MVQKVPELVKLIEHREAEVEQCNMLLLLLLVIIAILQATLGVYLAGYLWGTFFASFTLLMSAQFFAGESCMSVCVWQYVGCGLWLQ